MSTTNPTLQTPKKPGRLERPDPTTTLAITWLLAVLAGGSVLVTRYLDMQAFMKALGFAVTVGGLYLATVLSVLRLHSVCIARQ